MLESTNHNFYLYCLELERKLEGQTGQELLVYPYQPELFRESNYVPHYSWRFAQIIPTDYGQAAVYIRNPVKLWGTPLAWLVAMIAAITSMVFFYFGDPKATISSLVMFGAILSAIGISRY